MTLRTRKQREAAFNIIFLTLVIIAVYVAISWAMSLYLGLWGWLVLPGFFGGVGLLSWGIASWIDAGESEEG